MNATSTMPPNSVVLNYTVFFNQSGISPLFIFLELQNVLYPEGILTFDNGANVKGYFPLTTPPLPESYSVDDNGIASFQESIILPGNVPQAFYRDGQASLLLYLTSFVGNTSLISPSDERMDSTPVFLSIMQQEEGTIILITNFLSCIDYDLCSCLHGA